MGYHNKDYNINPKIKAMLEKKLNKTTYTYVELDLLMIRIFKGESEGNIVLTDDKRKQVIDYLTNISVNDYNETHLTNISLFMKKILTVDENITIVKKHIDIIYKPGMVYNLYRISNKKITHFYSQFSDLIKLNNAIVINPTYVGDVKKILPDIKVNEESGEIIDIDIVNQLKEYFKGLMLEFNGVKIGSINDNYVIASEDPELINYIQSESKGLSTEMIPVYTIQWL